MQRFTKVEDLIDYIQSLQNNSGSSNAAFARDLGISKQYLTDIYKGRTASVSDTVLDAVGFRCEKTYVQTGKISFPVRRSNSVTSTRKKDKKRWR